MFRNILNNIVNDSVNTTRNQVAWEGASEIERATFGKVFSFVEGVLALIAVFGCVIISNVMQNSHFLMYAVGLIWLIPFIVVGGLLARFRASLFIRLRGLISGLLGGNRF